MTATTPASTAPTSTTGGSARPKQARGLRTRAKLIEATRTVVAEVGYGQATTKAIAAEAGVAEGTIYRHFQDKHELYMAAVFEANAGLMDVVARLPERAGTAPVADLLGAALQSLASLRDELMPIELSLLSQPALRDELLASAPDEALGPVLAITDYIAAEQQLGRIRPGLDPDAVAMTLLSAIFGLALVPGSDDPTRFMGLVDQAIDVLMAGLVVSA